MTTLLYGNCSIGMSSRHDQLLSDLTIICGFRQMRSIQVTKLEELSSSGSVVAKLN